MSRTLTWMVSAAALALVASASAAQPDWAAVDQAIGKKGAEQPGGVHKYSFPRTDLNVTIDGVTIKPALALGGWIAFAPTADGAMFMGDLVLLDTEINPVMKRLIADGMEITAIHNHLLRTSLPVFYMHVGGHGDPVKLAATLHAALAVSKTPLSPPPAAPPPALELDTAALEKTLGFKGTANGGVYQFSVPRAESISAGGMAILPSMGTAIGINFQPTGGGKAAVTGDFVLLGSEVNPVLRALRQQGIEVTALHSHMIEDSPHLFFMHFWANDDALMLAQGLRAALDLANVAHLARAESPAQSVAGGASAAPRVVFVCEHGSVKSLIATSYFNRRAQERGLSIRAISRGATPEPSVPDSVRNGLHDAGFDVSAYVPRLLKASDLEGAKLVVSFDQDVSRTVGVRARYLKWDNMPGVLADYPRGRDAIVKQIDSLVDEFARRGSP
jgi:hypothetical protein